MSMYMMPAAAKAGCCASAAALSASAEGTFSGMPQCTTGLLVVWVPHQTMKMNLLMKLRMKAMIKMVQLL